MDVSCICTCSVGACVASSLCAFVMVIMKLKCICVFFAVIFFVVHVDWVEGGPFHIHGVFCLLVGHGFRSIFVCDFLMFAK